MNLIVLAAGQGTRFYPTTKYIPKALVRVKRRPLIEHVLEPFQGSVTKIIIVINDETGDQLKAYLGDYYETIPIEYVVQKLSDARGTWSALLCAVNNLDQDNYFMVTNCDDIYNRSEVQQLVSEELTVTMAVTRAVMPKKYLGIVISEGYVQGFQSHSNSIAEQVEDVFCNGLYILSLELLKVAPVQITGGEFGLPQTLIANKIMIPCKAFTMNYWVSINKPDDINKLN